MFYTFVLIAGFGGGVVRGLMGYVKHQYSYKNVGFDLPYFLTMMIISGVMGLLVAAAVKELASDVLTVGFSTAVAFVAGYAGGDFLESLYKVIIKKPTK
jgi:ABC-type thiamin/hydroxymethylpyrimidine transport system permease subunit